MALKFPVTFPLFAPSPAAPSGRPATEVRLSRWNNANAEPFLRRRRRQQEIEDDLRRLRRFQSALKIAADESTSGDPTGTLIPPRPGPPAPAFRSHGTPSAPSSPSIPGKASKYSKPPLDPSPSPNSHTAFRRIARGFGRVPPEPDEETGISVGEKGIAYRVKDAPFEYQYSYTETPKVKPLALREPPFLPFGPTTMPRPWTGRAPLPPSKKKLPEFDSFKLPPPGKKGVKSVQAPGPFLAGAGPKYHAASREEILGEPLTTEEIKELVKGCLKTKRQLNMGRDGLTHNMLDNIHAHWKRRRVCKIKCKGVCTVDMDNVRQQLEEKTGGKIIYSKGGVIFLFRGRNYNYKTRPRYPLMLWRPVTPVYPRLVQRAPEGLTLEEATEMRKRGRQLPPICKLGKNAVYHYLVKQVKEAFEACELVRINCKGLNKSDCRKIGAKLKDLVPCVLLSFEYEHILMWRGKDWKSSLPPLKDNHSEGAELIASDPTTTPTSAAESLASEQDVLGAGARKSTDEEFSYRSSLGDATLDGHLGVGGTEDLPNLENMIHPLPFFAANSIKMTDEAFDFSSVMHRESSFAIQKEVPASGAGNNSKESCLELPCQQVSLNEISSLEAKELDKSSLPPLEDNYSEGAELIATDPMTTSTSAADSLVSEQDVLSAGARKSADEEFNYKSSLESTTVDGHLSVGVGGTEDLPNLENSSHPLPLPALDSTKLTVKDSDFSSVMHRESSFVIQEEAPASSAGSNSEESCLEIPCQQVSLNEISSLEEKEIDFSRSAIEAQLLAACTVESTRIKKSGAATGLDSPTGSRDNLGTKEADSLVCQNSMRSGEACLEGVRLLLKQAVESGSAVILDESLDANIVYERAVALAKTAPPGPVFLHRIRKAAVQRTSKEKGEEQKKQDSDIEVNTISVKRHNDGKNTRGRRRDEFQETLSDVVPHGSLKVDELAKLLS